MKGHFFWVALSLIGISWMANSLYAYSKQLDEPIFLDHYIDMAYQDHLYVRFFYLTNKNDTSVINSMNAGDLSAYPEQSNGFFNNTHQIYNHQDFGRYVLRSVDVEFYNPYGDQLDYETTEMDVVFSDGRVVTTPIGHLMTHPLHLNTRPLEQTSSGSNNHNFSQSYYRALEPLTIHSVEHSFKDDLQDDFFIKMNRPKTPLDSKAAEADFLDSMDQEWNDLPGLNLRNVAFPIQLNEHDRISIHSKFPTNSTKVLNVNIYMKGTTESGKDFTTTSGIFTQPYLEKQDVKAIIKAKTKGDTDE
ncbi:hypothetical protein [Sporosarcina sp. FSL K6-2383]|uniref:hypothetical protein n=1 Tax=Sporosarcina sp. FSL K6-2383 TaxID=2921556 RepID=UPI00315AEEDE